MPENHYVVLGIPVDSTQGEIKAAYRRLVKRFHPDRCSDETIPFLDIQEAYSVLGDPERRREYDERLRGGGKRGGRGSSTRAPAETVEPLIPERPPAFGPSSFFIPSHKRHAGSLFDHLTGPLERVRSWGAGEETEVEVALTGEQAARGGSLHLRIPARQRCRACGGRGGRGFFACVHCDGTGIEMSEYPLRLEFPPRVADNSTFRLPLDRLGLGGSRLVIRFRILP